MPDPAILRDSTQIVLPADVLAEVRADLDAKFTLTAVAVDDDFVRLIGSPVEIKAASDYLSRHGVSFP